MNVHIEPAENPRSEAPRIDRKFIEDHRLIDRYLEGKLPFKGARDLEDWCRAHPHYLSELRLAERTHASLRLLEAGGSPQDLREPPPPWWRTNYFLAGLAALAISSLIASWALAGKNALLRGELDDARSRVRLGSLQPPATQSMLRVTPDRAAAVGQARVAVNHDSPQMLDLRIDMSYSGQQQFRVTVDKRDQGRVMVIDNLLRDSNGDVKLAFNTSALSAGRYDVRIEALPLLGAPIAAGWLTLDVR